ncbi:hypothetical protein B0T19DRAFT_45137 [Cercophora scortea]|uniref:Uncharacterized protein n=1 Tax=Cercophora scortea TaxID=314031 RepID=A0AAE0ML49_9PEZI|nr:hypothetical protein B0T19DRAFT_45137 [Cercophora scortea]
MSRERERETIVCLIRDSIPQRRKKSRSVEYRRPACVLANMIPPRSSSLTKPQRAEQKNQCKNGGALLARFVWLDPRPPRPGPPRQTRQDMNDTPKTQLFLSRISVSPTHPTNHDGPQPALSHTVPSVQSTRLSFFSLWLVACTTAQPRPKHEHGMVPSAHPPPGLASPVSFPCGEDVEKPGSTQVSGQARLWFPFLLVFLSCSLCVCVTVTDFFTRHRSRRRRAITRSFS